MVATVPERSPAMATRKGKSMKVREVEILARAHNMAGVSTHDVDDTTAEMVVEFADKSDAHAFAAAVSVRGVRAYGPWKHDLPGFNHMVTVYADTE